MENWQKLILVVYLTGAVVGLLISIKNVVRDKNNLGLTGIYNLYGSFVWADMIVFGIYWILFTTLVFIISDWYLFLLGLSLFWFVRSFGEAIYWFNQQFSTVKRQPYKNFFFAKLFNNDEYTIWFVMQIIMQCVTVVSAILSIYFGKLWIDGL